MRDNRILNVVKTLAEEGLKASGITGIKVIQHAQPIATSDHACVLISKISIHRYGWQGVQYDKNTPTYKTIKESWDYMDECDYQISAFVPRKETDSVEQLTSYDIVAALATYLNSYQGIMKSKELGLQPLRVMEIQTPIQQDDSASPQFNPNFDFRFLIHQTPSVDVPTIEKIVITSGKYVPDQSPQLDKIEQTLEAEKARVKEIAQEVVVDYHHRGIHGV